MQGEAVAGPEMGSILGSMEHEHVEHDHPGMNASEIYDSGPPCGPSESSSEFPKAHTESVGARANKADSAWKAGEKVREEAYLSSLGHGVVRNGSLCVFCEYAATMFCRECAEFLCPDCDDTAHRGGGQQGLHHRVGLVGPLEQLHPRTIQLQPLQRISFLENTVGAVELVITGVVSARPVPVGPVPCPDCNGRMRATTMTRSDSTARRTISYVDLKGRPYACV